MLRIMVGWSSEAFWCIKSEGMLLIALFLLSK
jgi:hypothetical protein